MVFKILDSDALFSNIELNLDKCGTNWSAVDVENKLILICLAFYQSKIKRYKLTVKHLDLVLLKMFFKMQRLFKLNAILCKTGR